MPSNPTPSRESKETRIPLAREELQVTKREVETGRVRVTKVVREQEKLVEESLLRNEVEVTRVPVDRVVSEPPEARYEGDTLVLPVLEEVLVLQKQWLLKEEVRIRQTTAQTPHRQRVVLRSEEAIVEREGERRSEASLQPNEPERT